MNTLTVEKARWVKESDNKQCFIVEGQLLGMVRRVGLDWLADFFIRDASCGWPYDTETQAKCAVELAAGI